MVCVTVTVAESAAPPGAVATMQVLPLATAVTTPAVSTVAMPPSHDVQVQLTPPTAAFAASRASASRSTVAPRAVSVGASGVTVTVAPRTPRRIVPL